MNEKIKFVELFAGANGLGEGFILENFQSIAMVEMDKYCCDTIKTRLAYHQLKKEHKLNLYRKYLKDYLGKMESFNFRAKIILFEIISKDSNLIMRLNEFRKLRNKFAHNNTPPQKKLLDFIHDIKKLKEKIQNI